MMKSFRTLKGKKHSPEQIEETCNESVMVQFKRSDVMKCTYNIFVLGQDPNQPNISMRMPKNGNFANTLGRQYWNDQPQK